MITFLIEIEQTANGRVRFTCATPPGPATVRETEIARIFQKAVSQMAALDDRVTVHKPWSDSNNPNRPFRGRT